MSLCHALMGIYLIMMCKFTPLVVFSKLNDEFDLDNISTTNSSPLSLTSTVARFSCLHLPFFYSFLNISYASSHQKLLSYPACKKKASNVWSFIQVNSTTYRKECV